MNQLRDLVGREHESSGLHRTLRRFANSQRAAAVGAVLVTCSDECEHEAAESFQHWFADGLLPELKAWSRAPFRLANLGGRYEWGAIPCAEQHCATPKTHEHFKMLLVKLSSHVSIVRHHNHSRFGAMVRYGTPSQCCGALNALLEGQPGPAINDLRRTFASEGRPRLEMLCDAGQTDPHLRCLLAAVVNTRLQARRAVVDIQHHHPESPTLYLVVACVTLNHKLHDSELVVGCYLADHRREPLNVQYFGLEDDPSQYDVSLHHGRIRIADHAVEGPRDARDHREEIMNVWLRRREQEAIVRDERLLEIARQVAEKRHENPNFVHEMLKTLGWLLLDLSPVSTSLLLFAKGAAGAHHLYNVHCLARGHQDRYGASAILNEFLASIDSLPPDRARTLVEALLDHHLLGDKQ